MLHETLVDFTVLLRVLNQGTLAGVLGVMRIQ